MNRRFLILAAGIAAFEWALLAGGLALADEPIATVLGLPTVLVAVGNGLGLALLQALKWAMRGDR